MNKRSRPDYCIKDVDSTKDLNINYVFRQKPKFDLNNIPPFYAYENRPIAIRKNVEMDLQANDQTNYKEKMEELNKSEIRELIKINSVLCNKAKEDHRRIVDNVTGLNSYIFVSGHGRRKLYGHK